MYAAGAKPVGAIETVLLRGIEEATFRCNTIQVRLSLRGAEGDAAIYFVSRLRLVS